MNAYDLMMMAPVIPVIVVEDVEIAVPLAESLVAGGLPVLEVTLRTPQAMDAMRAMQSVKGAVVGVGTAVNGKDLKAAKEAGAQFAVSPGFTDEIAVTAKEIDLPLLPGIANSSDTPTTPTITYRLTTSCAAVARGSHQKIKFKPVTGQASKRLLKPRLIYRVDHSKLNNKIASIRTTTAPTIAFTPQASAKGPVGDA